jgi:hypothetical protein
MTISLRAQQNLIESFLKEWPGTVKDIGGKTRTRPMIVVATQ